MRKNCFPLLSEFDEMRIIYIYIYIYKFMFNVDLVVLYICGMNESETLFDICITRLCSKEFHKMNNTPSTPKLKHVLKLFC